jgi:crossover junction endodeoxyribonuclease RuvC
VNGTGTSITTGSKATPPPRRVLGIDPGLNVTGYAVVEPGRSGTRIVEAGVIRPGKAGSTLAVRLDLLHRGIVEIIRAFEPKALALEQVHSHARFPRTALLMAHARGVIVLAAAQNGVAVHGYAPARIKKSLTGSGRAGKEAMQRAIRVELGLDRDPEPHDVADACAVALCHYQVERNGQGLVGLG